jgi:hypothetical protein
VLGYPGQTVTITTITTGATICYTTDGSTPTATTPGTCSHGTSLTNGGTVTLSSPGTTTAQAIGTLSGDVNSSAASATFALYADTAVASDNFSSYYNSNYLDYLVFSPPLDLQWTGTGYGTTAAWENVGFANYGGVAVDNNGVIIAASVNSLSKPVPVARVYEGYYAGQASLDTLSAVGNGGAGAGVRCSPGSSLNGYILYGSAVSSGSAFLGKYVSGAWSNIANASGLSAITSGATLELRIYGTTLQPLLNGAAIPGMSATYTDSDLSTGQPCIAVSTDSSVTTWHGYNVGGSASGYTPPTAPYPTTYTDAMNTSGWVPSSSWLHFNNSPWTGAFGAEANSSGYAAGISALNGTQYLYQRGVFGVNQWATYTVAINSTDTRFANWFTPLEEQGWVPGYSNGGCTSAGTTASCYDPLAYYFGEEPMRAYIAGTGIAAACSGKSEYCGTPFFHGTKVTPAASAGDQVVLWAPSNTTVMYEDQVLVEYNQGWLNAYCEQSSSPPAAWAASHAYSVGDVFLDPNYAIQVVTVAGTSGGTIPSTWGTTWNFGTYSGATTTSGGATSMYFGKACLPGAFHQFIHVKDSDLSNTTANPPGYSAPLGVGAPAIWGGTSTSGGASGAAFPILSNWSAGTFGYGTGYPCSTEACTYMNANSGMGWVW